MLDIEGSKRVVRDILEESHTDALIISKNGRIKFEYFSNGMTEDSRHLAFSVSKSVTGILAGIVLKKWNIDPSCLVSDLIQLPSGSAYEGATIRNLLDMTVSVDFDESYTSKIGTYARYRRAMLWMPRDNSIDVNNENLTNFILSLPKADYEHGEKFSYKSPNSDLLGLILQKISNKPLVDIFSDLLWKKIGCSNANITIDDDGLARMAGGLSCTIYDLFRIAEVIRNGGYLNGELLIDPIWVIDTINNGDRNAWEKGEFFDSFPLGNYRNQWYSFNDGILCAIGIHGQWIYIDIPKMIVICKFSSQPEAVDAMLDKLTLKFFEETAKYFV